MGLEFMRLFVGIEFSDEIIDQLLMVQDDIRRQAKCGRFVGRPNLHLTLQFLGEVSVEKVEPIVQALQKASQKHRAFSLALKEVGSFRSGNAFRVIWVGIDGEKQKLIELQKDTSVFLDEVGFPQEKRPYKPHITLGRNVEFADKVLFEQFSNRLPQSYFFVDKISLIESKVENGKRIYQSLYSFPLECGD